MQLPIDYCTDAPEGLVIMLHQGMVRGNTSDLGDLSKHNLNLYYLPV